MSAKEVKIFKKKILDLEKKGYTKNQILKILEKEYADSSEDELYEYENDEDTEEYEDDEDEETDESESEYEYSDEYDSDE